MTVSLTLLLIIAVVGTPQGPKLTRKASGRSFGTSHFVEIVTVFFTSFKPCRASNELLALGGLQTKYRLSREL